MNNFKNSIQKIQKFQEDNQREFDTDRFNFIEVCMMSILKMVIQNKLETESILFCKAFYDYFMTQNSNLQKQIGLYFNSISKEKEIEEIKITKNVCTSTIPVSSSYEYINHNNIFNDSLVDESEMQKIKMENAENKFNNKQKNYYSKVILKSHDNFNTDFIENIDINDLMEQDSSQDHQFVSKDKAIQSIKLAYETPKDMPNRKSVGSYRSLTLNRQSNNVNNFTSTDGIVQKIGEQKGDKLIDFKKIGFNRDKSESFIEKKDHKLHLSSSPRKMFAKYDNDHKNISNSPRRFAKRNSAIINEKIINKSDGIHDLDVKKSKDNLTKKIGAIKNLINNRK